MRRRQLLVFLAAVVAFSAIIFPAQATSTDVIDPHKVYVCHETGAADKFVLIHVDWAAWWNGHGEQHGNDFLPDGPDFSCVDEDPGG